MTGSPVWLASLSRMNPITHEPIATGNWTPQTVQESRDVLMRFLGPVGNEYRQRLFRFNATLCLQRALTGEEVQRLPSYFFAEPAVDLAGGPIEVLWETEPGALTTQPCERPDHGPTAMRNPQLWIPLDCGDCPPCKARASIDRAIDLKVAALGGRRRPISA